jgi:hypothetical protein
VRTRRSSQIFAGMDDSDCCEFSKLVRGGVTGKKYAAQQRSPTAALRSPKTRRCDAVLGGRDRIERSAARELMPKGIHVAHIVVNGAVRAAGCSDVQDQTLDPDALARVETGAAWTLSNEAQAPTADMAETPPSIRKSAPTTYVESSDAR